MDNARIDHAARLLRSRLTRRRGLGLVAIGFTELLPWEAAAGCKKRCGACERCKKGKCKARANGTVCGDGRVCRHGVCRCGPEGTPCASYESCCSMTCDSLVGGGTCAPCQGRTCSASRPCCGGLPCSNGYCGGCRDRATSCTDDTQCCFSDCKNGACLSLAGGRCARDVDCRICYLNRECEGACINGACTA